MGGRHPRSHCRVSAGGIGEAIGVRSNGVSTMPGQTALMRRPSGVGKRQLVQYLNQSMQYGNTHRPTRCTLSYRYIACRVPSCLTLRSVILFNKLIYISHVRPPGSGRDGQSLLPPCRRGVPSGVSPADCSVPSEQVNGSAPPPLRALGSSQAPPKRSMPPHTRWWHCSTASGSKPTTSAARPASPSGLLRPPWEARPMRWSSCRRPAIGRRAAVMEATQEERWLG